MFNYKAGGNARGSGVRLAIVCLTSLQGEPPDYTQIGSFQGASHISPAWAASPAAEKEGLLFIFILFIFH